MSWTHAIYPLGGCIKRRFTQDRAREEDGPGLESLPPVAEGVARIGERD